MRVNLLGLLVDGIINIFPDLNDLVKQLIQNIQIAKNEGQLWLLDLNVKSVLFVDCHLNELMAEREDEFPLVFLILVDDQQALKIQRKAIQSANHFIINVLQRLFLFQE